MFLYLAKLRERPGQPVELAFLVVERHADPDQAVIRAALRQLLDIQVRTACAVFDNDTVVIIQIFRRLFVCLASDVERNNGYPAVKTARVGVLYDSRVAQQKLCAISQKLCFVPPDGAHARLVDGQEGARKRNGTEYVVGTGFVPHRRVFEDDFAWRDHLCDAGTEAQRACLIEHVLVADEHTRKIRRVYLVRAERKVIDARHTILRIHVDRAVLDKLGRVQEYLGAVPMRKARDIVIRRDISGHVARPRHRDKLDASTVEMQFALQIGHREPSVGRHVNKHRIKAKFPRQVVRHMFHIRRDDDGSMACAPLRKNVGEQIDGFGRVLGVDRRIPMHIRVDKPFDRLSPLFIQRRQKRGFERLLRHVFVPRRIFLYLVDNRMKRRCRAAVVKIDIIQIAGFRRQKRLDIRHKVPQSIGCILVVNHRVFHSKLYSCIVYSFGTTRVIEKSGQLKTTPVQKDKSVVIPGVFFTDLAVRWAVRLASPHFFP